MKLRKVIVFLLVLQTTFTLYGEKFIVSLKSGAKRAILDSKVEVLDYNKHGIALVNADSTTLKKLAGDKTIVYYEKPAKAKAFFIPNDYYYGYQWDFDILGMENVWDVTMGAGTVTVGILDTGVGYENFTIPSYEQNEVVSGDNSYHIGSDFNTSSFVSGYDYIHDDTHPNDQNAHGTHVAGTIVEATNNNIGVAGMSPGVKIMPVQVLDYKGEGDSYTIAKGIYYACDHGADVINMSLGGAPGDSSGWHTVHLAIIHACSLNIPVVVASGNSGTGELSYPAGFREAFSCGAVNRYKNRTSYSQYGAGIDFVMPGGDDANMILQQTFRGYDSEYGTLARVDSFAYYYYEGTSMAAPHLTAAIALLKSVGIQNINEIYGRLAYFATDLGSSGYDQYYGNGLPDIYTSLTSNYSDNTPPVFKVYLVKNPVFNGFIDVWVRSDEELMNGEVDSIVAESNGERQLLNGDFLQDRLFAAKFRFSSDGNYNIYVYGKDVWGNPGQNSTLFSLFRIPKDEKKIINMNDLTFFFDRGVVTSDCIARIEKQRNGFVMSVPQNLRKSVYVKCSLPDVIIADSVGNSVNKDADGRFIIAQNGSYHFIWDIKTRKVKGGVRLISKSGVSGVLSVIALDGRLIEKKSIENKKEIVLRNLNRGVYFAVISSGKTVLKKRFDIW